MDKENKNHWYDGLFYDMIIAPNQDKSFALIKKIINPGSNLLDVGCGTGRLAIQIADKCSKVDGIDLSIKNVKLANKRLSASNSINVAFHHDDVFKFLSAKNNKYDYAVLSYVIHEVDFSFRVEILKLLSQTADKIIIVDYLTPRSNGFWSMLNEVVEFFAGREHYRNFKSYIRENGVYGLAEKSGLKIIKEIKNIPSTSQIVILTKNQSRRIKTAPSRINKTAIIFLIRFESLNILPPIIVAHKTEVRLTASVSATEARLIAITWVKR